MAYKNFDKKTGSGASVNEQLPKELHKPAIKNFKKRKVYARFKDYARMVRKKMIFQYTPHIIKTIQ